MQATKSNLAFDSIPNFPSGRKLAEVHKVILWELLVEDPKCPTPKVLKQAKQVHGAIPVSVRHINRLRVGWRLNRDKGRPLKPKPEKDTPSELVKLTPNLPCIGIHLFSAWMDKQDYFSGVLTLLKQVIEAYCKNNPDKTFPLLHHREETLLRRFKALFFAPLFKIGKLTEFDVKEHALATLIGRGYQSSTLNQFLGQLERIDAGKSLMPALINTGRVCYIDGHMIAFWTTVSMHKGKITMLGRIMAGSQAVIAHNERGDAVFVEYYPPDMRFTHMILEYCEKIVSTTGIEIFVIDREINSKTTAYMFESKKWGLLSMLDKNEYTDLSDWNTKFEGKLEDGNNVYSGHWKEPRKDDPRSFVIVEQNEKLLVYWGTSKVKEMLKPLEWPGTYSQRAEIQENSFKRMIEHGALNINYGTKKIMGPDRHQERAKAKAEDALTATRKKIEKKENLLREQQEKVMESEEKGHGKRLLQRQKRLAVMEETLKEVEKKEEKIEDQIKALGPKKQRADRDFRKQLIMTFRTLLLENALMSFFGTLFEKADIKMCSDSLIDMLFMRSGAYAETYSKVVYWINTAGLSAPNKEKLKDIAKGLNAMHLKHGSKPIQVRLREAPS
jgi:hypothetical protein